MPTTTTAAAGTVTFGATVIDRRVLDRVRLVQDGCLGVGGLFGDALFRFGRLVLGSLLDVHLGAQGLDGFAELLTRLGDVRLNFVDSRVGPGFRTSGFRLAHWRASFTSLMSALTLSALSVTGGVISSACLRLNSAAIPAATNKTTATMTAAAQTGRTSANAATAAAIKRGQPEYGQQTRPR